MDRAFKALADPNRRRLLDRLNAANGQTLKELCAGLDMTRQSVTKHLAVLEGAELVATIRRGREKLHYLNAAPISDIADRWISRYDRPRVRALADLKRALEETPMDKPTFVYVTYIETTPKKLWRALTDPEFTVQYWGGGPSSDWMVGSPITWRSTPDGELEDLGQTVLEADPYRRLSYTWHNYQPMHAELFGWSTDQLAELVKEKISKVTFTLEESGPMVKLTVVHDGFEGETEMLQGISQGWPAILSKLKILLETGAAPARSGV
jgi:uncharacterized protein YndB with AHSA1/START domain